jgi:hypothetical protein
MAVATLSYLDLSVEQRREAARRVRAQIRQQLSMHEAGSEGHRALLGQLDRINRWEQGNLHRQSVNHDVAVVDIIPLKEG